MENYTCKHFSLSLPENIKGQSVIELLRHLADTLQNENVTEVMDIIFHIETNDEGAEIPFVTVYY